MITTEMYRMMRARQFGGEQPKQSRHAIGTAQVRRIHELLEQGWKCKEIAELLGVSESHVYYRRSKMKGLR